MTPLADVAGLPLSGGLVAGVRLEPNGLEFIQPATLRMTTPEPMDQAQFTGFSAESDGINLSWEPWFFENENTVIMPLQNFSNHAGAKGTAEEQDTKPPACDRHKRFHETVARHMKRATKAAKNEDEALLQQIIAQVGAYIVTYHRDVIIPQLEAAVNNDA